MKNILIFLLSVLTVPFAFGQNSVDFNASDNWIGYMNVFDLPSAGGAYQFGSFWAVPDMKSVLDTPTNTITLHPNFNTYADNPTDPFWVDQSTGAGNKDMEAVTFVEPGASFNGNDLTFSGIVVSNTLDAGYEAKFFIKALDSLNGYQDALAGSKVFDLPASGNFSVSVTAAEIPTGLLVQYGFSIRGTNANPVDEATLGNIVIAAADTSSNIVEAGAMDNWIGYMNVFDLASAGGAYQFGSSWAIPDLKTTLDTPANQVVLQPNFSTYTDNPTDPFWVDQSTGAGNKDLEAATFVEPGSGFNGRDLTFFGNVVSNTLDAGYEAKFYIKALDPNNGYLDALGGSKTFDLPASGAFTVSATAAELPPGLIVQYGFSVRGTNANPVDEAALGSVVIGDPTVSVDKIDAASAISIYPNPASDLLNISSEKMIQNYRIISLSGAVVQQGNINNNSIDIFELQSGLYFLEFDFEEGREIKTFVKK